MTKESRLEVLFQGEDVVTGSIFKRNGLKFPLELPAETIMESRPGRRLPPLKGRGYRISHPVPGADLMSIRVVPRKERAFRPLWEEGFFDGYPVPSELGALYQ